MDEKKYLVSVYIDSERNGLFVNDMIDSHLFCLLRSIEGRGDTLAIYDGKTSQRGLKLLLSAFIPYFPLNNYQDFVITCPNCGERIDDEMILRQYDETTLSGNNIKCERKGCGVQRANVSFLLE